MFQINDVIIYGTQGVCEIVNIEEKTVSGVKKTYFVLKPVNDKGATIFVPTDNVLVLKKMRRLISQEEILTLIHSMPEENAPWVDNFNIYIGKNGTSNYGDCYYKTIPQSACRLTALFTQGPTTAQQKSLHSSHQGPAQASFNFPLRASLFMTVFCMMSGVMYLPKALF